MGAGRESGAAAWADLWGEGFFVPTALSDAEVESGATYLVNKWGA